MAFNAASVGQDSLLSPLTDTRSISSSTDPANPDNARQSDAYRADATPRADHATETEEAQADDTQDSLRDGVTEGHETTDRQLLATFVAHTRAEILSRTRANKNEPFLPALAGQKGIDAEDITAYRFAQLGTPPSISDAPLTGLSDVEVSAYRLAQPVNAQPANAQQTNAQQTNAQPANAMRLPGVMRLPGDLPIFRETNGSRFLIRQGGAWFQVRWDRDNDTWRIAQPDKSTAPGIPVRWGHAGWEVHNAVGAPAGGKEDGTEGEANMQPTVLRETDWNAGKKLDRVIPKHIKSGRTPYPLSNGTVCVPQDRISQTPTVARADEILLLTCDITPRVPLDAIFYECFNFMVEQGGTRVLVVPTPQFGDAGGDAGGNIDTNQAIAEEIKEFVVGLYDNSPTFRGLVNRMIDNGSLGTTSLNRWTFCVMLEPYQDGGVAGADRFTVNFQQRTIFIPSLRNQPEQAFFYLAVDGNLVRPTPRRAIVYTLMQMLTGEIPLRLGLRERGVNIYLGERVMRERGTPMSQLSSGLRIDKSCVNFSRTPAGHPTCELNANTAKAIKEAGGIDPLKEYVDLQNQFLDGKHPPSLPPTAKPQTQETQVPTAPLMAMVLPPTPMPHLPSDMREPTPPAASTSTGQPLISMTASKLTAQPSSPMTASVSTAQRPSSSDISVTHSGVPQSIDTATATPTSTRASTRASTPADASASALASTPASASPPASPPAPVPNPAPALTLAPTPEQEQKHHANKQPFDVPVPAPYARMVSIGKRRVFFSETETLVQLERIRLQCDDLTGSEDELLEFADYFIGKVGKSYAAEEYAVIRELRKCYNTLLKSRTFRKLLHRAKALGYIGNTKELLWTFQVVYPHLGVFDSVPKRANYGSEAFNVDVNRRTIRVPIPSDMLAVGPVYISTTGALISLRTYHIFVRNLVRALTSMPDPNLSLWGAYGNPTAENIKRLGLGERGANEVLTEIILKEAGLPVSTPLLSSLYFKNEPYATTGNIRRAIEAAGGAELLKEYVEAQNRYIGERYWPDEPATAPTSATGGLPELTPMPEGPSTSKATFPSTDIARLTSQPLGQRIGKRSTAAASAVYKLNPFFLRNVYQKNMAMAPTVQRVRNFLGRLPDSSLNPALTPLGDHVLVKVSQVGRSIYAKNGDTLLTPEETKAFPQRIMQEVQDIISSLYLESETFRRLANYGINPQTRQQMHRVVLYVVLEEKIEDAMAQYGQRFSINTTVNRIPIPHLGANYISGSYYLSTSGHVVAMETRRLMIENIVIMLVLDRTPPPKPAVRELSDLAALNSRILGERQATSYIADRILTEMSVNHPEWEVPRRLSDVELSRKLITPANRPDGTGLDETHGELTPAALRALEEIGSLADLEDYCDMEDGYIDTRFFQNAPSDTPDRRRHRPNAGTNTDASTQDNVVAAKRRRPDDSDDNTSARPDDSSDHTSAKPDDSNSDD